jgi:hypothetical protein
MVPLSHVIIAEIALGLSLVRNQRCMEQTKTVTRTLDEAGQVRNGC